jgi:hypothetical protein
MSSNDPQPGQGARSRRGLFIACVGVLGVGLGAWGGCLAAGDAARAWRALLVNFVYFTPLAAGLATWPAVVMASRGAWMGPARRLALAAVGFAPVSLAAYLALCLGVEHWAPWLHAEDLPNRAWLNAPFLLTRDGVALAVFWGLAWRFAVRARTGRPIRLAIAVILAYAIAFSLIGFDLIMALDPHWYSTLLGGYVFMTGMYGAAAAWTLLVIVRRTGATPDRLGDLGNLLIAFSLIASYLMFSNLLPIWYENLPHETRYVAPRLNFATWQPVGVALLVVVYLGPLALLLPRGLKRTAWYLGAVAGLVLVGLWVERWWLVVPTLGGPPTPGVADASLAAAFLAALVLALRTAPAGEGGP